MVTSALAELSAKDGLFQRSAVLVEFSLSDFRIN
jgi:hypothetical protein